MALTESQKGRSTPPDPLPEVQACWPDLFPDFANGRVFILLTRFEAASRSHPIGSSIPMPSKKVRTRNMLSLESSSRTLAVRRTVELSGNSRDPSVAEVRTMTWRSLLLAENAQISLFK